MDQKIHFNPIDDLEQKLTLKIQANQLSERGVVHYLDLSRDSKRFDGLLPECNFYGDNEAFLSFLRNVNVDLEKRVTLFRNGESLDNYPFVTVIAVDLQSDDNKLSLDNALNPYYNYNRVLKYSLIIRGFDFNAGNEFHHIIRIPLSKRRD